MRRLPLFLLIALPLVLLACASAQRQYERGMELETQGQFSEAARYYATAIQRDPDLNPMVRGRLRESGRQAIDAYLRDARSLEQTGRLPEAADRYRDADAIVELGRTVGEVIPTPTNYGEMRRVAFDAAIDYLVEEGDAYQERRDYQNAVARFERSLTFDPDRDQSRNVNDRIGEARFYWAQASAEAGRYRQAFEIAGAGLQNGARYDVALRELQEDMLEAGTVRMAALPLQRLSGDVGDMPSRFVDDLTLLLEDDYWVRPPLFVSTAEPRDVRSVTRRRIGRDALLGNTRLVSDIGRDLGADFALAAGVDRFTRQAGEERRTNRTVRMRRGGASATYIEVRTPTTFRSAVRFEVVEVGSRRIVCNERVERSADGPVLRGEYAGDTRELDLTREQQELFTVGGVEDQERRIHDRLSENLAQALAERVFACVAARVP